MWSGWVLGVRVGGSLRSEGPVWGLLLPRAVCVQ